MFCAKTTNKNVNNFFFHFNHCIVTHNFMRIKQYDKNSNKFKSKVYNIIVIFNGCLLNFDRVKRNQLYLNFSNIRIMCVFFNSVSQIILGMKEHIESDGSKFSFNFHFFNLLPMQFFL